jgi:hypothetical protein
MRFTATRVFSLEAIGDIAFVFNTKSRRKGKRIIIGDVSILYETKMTIDEPTYKGLLKMMKLKGSDLLTDGRNFYTILHQEIVQIKHDQFIKELELDRELFLTRQGLN